MSTKTEKTELSYWRRLIFPIHRNEILQFIVMCFVFASCMFFYTTGRIAKDVLMGNAHGASPQVFAFLKFYCGIPASFLFVVFQTWLFKTFSKRSCFLIVALLFSSAFLFFANLVLPHREFFHASDATITSLQAAYPSLSNFIAIYGNWTYALFYIVTDLSGNTLLTFLFWNLANQITSKEDSKRINPAYGMYANITGNVLAGVSGKVLASCVSGSHEALLRIRLNTGAIALMMVLPAYLFIYYYLLSDEQRAAQNSLVGSTGKKPKMTMGSAAREVLGSRYLSMMGVITICYGCCMNLIEVTWKYCLKLNASSANAFMGELDDLYTLVGITSFAIGIVANVFNQRKSSLLISGLGTPMVIGVSGALFYMLCALSQPALVGNSLSLAANSLCNTLGFTGALHAAIVVGRIQNVLTKGLKYCFFDPFMQQAYCALNDTLRNVGKAAVDIFCGRLAKASGGGIQSTLAVITGASQMALIPMLAGVATIAWCMWVRSVLIINRLYKTPNA